MAEKRSEQERSELGAFIRELYVIGGYARWAEFADDARVHPVSLSNWQNGEKTPDGVNVLKLIRAAAARTNREARELATSLAVADRERLADRLEDVERGMTELAGLLRESLGEQEADESPAPQPKTSTAALEGERQ